MSYFLSPKLKVMFLLVGILLLIGQKYHPHFRCVLMDSQRTVVLLDTQITIS
jgi:hypothetical protein